MARKKRLQHAISHESEFVMKFNGKIDEQIVSDGSILGNIINSDKEIIIEVGCGKGERSLGFALENPDKNIIGIDKKGTRLSFGANGIVKNNLTNLCFIRGIANNMLHRFKPNSISQIHVIQPDPRGKGRDEHRRLTSPTFLELYNTLLKPNGKLIIQTDHEGLRNYTIDIIDKNMRKEIIKSDDFHSLDIYSRQMFYMTSFEKKAIDQGKKIFYGIWEKI